MADKDYSAEEESAWVADERKKVVAYLAAQGVDHLGVGEWPAWHVCPYLAVWAVQSKKSPGVVGWWAISGDVPTDYIGSADAKHPREAMVHFSRQWDALSNHMARGVAHPNSKIGNRSDWPTLAPLLRTRGELLGRFAADETIWSDQ